MRWMAGTVLSLYLLILLLANFSPAQRWLTDVVEASLERKLRTEVEIGHVEVGLFNRVMLHDVCLFDQGGKPLLSGGLLSVKVALAPLLQGEVSLRSVSLIDVTVKLRKDRREGPTNFAFVLDAFKSEKKGPSSLNLRINSLILRRCSVSYDETYRLRTPRAFNPGHIAATDIDANISLKRLTPDSLNLRVRHVAFREQSGLDVRDLSLRIAAGRRGAELSRFRLRLPHSEITERQLSARYDGRDLPTLLRTLRISGAVRGATIATEDIACFFPRLRGFDHHYRLSGGFTMQPESAVLRGLTLTDDDSCLTLRADLDMTRGKEGIAAARLRLGELTIRQTEAEAIVCDLLHRPLMSPVGRLGDIRLSGDAYYVAAGRSRAKLDIATAAGSLAVTAHHKGQELSAQVSSADFSPARLSGNQNLPDQVSFHLDGKADFARKAHPDLRLTARVEQFLLRGQTYRELQGSAAWVGSSLKADVTSADEKMGFTAQLAAAFDGKRLSDVSVDASVDRLSLMACGLSSRYGDDLLSGRVRGRIDRFSTTPRQAELLIENLEKRSLSGDTRYHLDHLSLNLSPGANGTHLSLDSDFARADIDGPLNADFFRSCFDELLVQVGDKRTAAPKALGARFVVQLRKTDFLNEMLGIPLTLDGPLTAEGYLGLGGQRSSVVVSNSGFAFGGVSARDVRLYVTGSEGNFSGLLQATKRIGKSDMKLDLQARTQEGRILTDLRWDDGQSHRYSGLLSLKSVIARQADGSLRYETDVLPTQFSLGDTIWNIHGGRLAVDPTGLSVKELRTTHADQSIRIDGSAASRHTSDSLLIDLRKVDLRYILSLVNLKPISLAGEVTGRIHAGSSPEGDMTLSGRLDIPEFLINDGPMGHANIFASFNLRNARLGLDVDIRENGLSETRVEGYVGIDEKELDLLVTSRNTPLLFLRRYLSGFLEDINGRTTGTCRVYGPFKTIDFEGVERPSVDLGIPSTGVRYHAGGGTVRLTGGRMDFSAFNLSEAGGGTGKLDGEVRHRHLKDVRYDFRASGSRLKLYDKPKSADMPFWATVYGNANAHLSGLPGSMTVDLDLTPTAGTDFTYLIDTPESFADVSLLRFHDRVAAEEEENGADEASSEARYGTAREEDKDQAQTDIILNFQVGMTPDAALRVIMDERTGDHILLRGTGALRAGFYNKTGFKMYGIYNVERGTYKMSIQDVIHKEFNFRQGGSITFAGDPFEADLDLNAVYTVPSASLSDLGLGLNVSSGTVRANCELTFSGKVKAPQVKFGLDLPTVSDEVKYMVNQLIATEEDMNTQIIYLLGVGRFSPINYAATESAAEGQSQSSVAMKSFLSSTLSGQLNNIISGAMNNSNWTFGTNLSTGSVGWSDMEVEGLLSGRLLNNRLLINGNFGYRDRPTSNTNFIGDFDISYLLTPAGGVSLKAYSETNDRYFSKSSMTTQGIGIQFKRDFTSLRDLFFWRKGKKKAR